MNNTILADQHQRLSGSSRREFLATSALAATSLAISASSYGAAAAQAKRKIKLGVVGNGGRGSWIAKLFQQHGGYDMYAVADYSQQVADACGDALGIEKGRRFSGLSGYQKLIASGVEAVALETPPFFFPQHANAAVDAGCHVYMAKPVAVDVPGALLVQKLGQAASAKQRCFLVDYQMPDDPVNIEVAKRINEGGLGKMAHVCTYGYCSGFPDPPKTSTIESRLRNLVWVNDVALGCDYIGNFDIHATDAAIWVLGQRPIAAMGLSRICRKDPHGDSHDVCQIVYEFADGLTLSHHGQALPNNPDESLVSKFYGQDAMAVVAYSGKAYLRGGPKHFGGGNVDNLYEAGARRNIATFHDNIVEGRFENATVARAVDGVLMSILGRESAARKSRLTMEELIRRNERLEVNLNGLRA